MCVTPLDCFEELRFGIWTASGDSYSAMQYPGGLCGTTCSPEGDPSACGDCTTCVDHGLLGRVLVPAIGRNADGSGLVPLPGVCRANCTPDVATNGGCSAGSTCAVDGHVCLEACRSDDDCNVTIQGGYLTPDPGGPWACNTVTGRCELFGTPGARAGDPCAADTECMDDGECLRTAPGGGFCTRFGCDAAGFECGAGETCALRQERSLCLPPCRVGEEPEADRLGRGGHGAGCAPGRACFWDGRTADASGGCMPGNYNDVTTPNVGDACVDDLDCYSPFGYGTCFRRRGIATGVCSITECAFADGTGIVPGVTTGTRVCDRDAGELCVGMAGIGGPSFCMLTCIDASECGPGVACANALTGTFAKVCWPECDTSNDCLEGAACENTDGARCNRGRGDRDCTCTAGTALPIDAGTTDAGTTDTGTWDAGARGADGGTPRLVEYGCACRASRASAGDSRGPPWWSVALLFLFARRRRRVCELESFT